MSENDLIFWFWAVGLPILIAAGAWIAVLLHEHSVDR
jgi:hypothetical protein